MSHPFDGIDEKLKRADQHISQLHDAVETFLNKGPNRALADFDAESAESFKRLHERRIVPVPFSIHAGEILYQLRSSLDHAACLLILKDGGKLSDRSQYPIFRFEPTEKDDIRRYERQIEGITRPDVLARLKDTQPYIRKDRRDAHPLAILKLLSNEDKHRWLLLHVVTIMPNFQFALGPPVDSSNLGAKQAWFREGGQTFGIVDVQRKLTAHVAFPKFGAKLTNFDVMDGLRALRDATVDVIGLFRPLL